jgi:PAS domain S-box-containing protein
MRRTDVTPTGVERRFHPDQIIVSKTDLKGRLTYVNKLFVEISAYAEEDLLGQPHNVIRHPDMPRVIFALLWERIAAGEEIFAYVVNLAHDGAHYWVLAHVTPTLDGAGRIIGYHSNRRTVSQDKSAKIAALYREISAAEGRYSSAREAVDAGRQVLNRKLQELGMTYDEFLWSIASAEAVAA